MTGLSSVRKVPLGAQRAFDASLIYYPAGHTQGRHEHDRASLAVVLGGSLVEEVDCRNHSGGPGQLSLKPSRVAHADCYGRDGAVLLSLVFRCEQTADEAIGRTGWQWRNAGAAVPSIAFALRTPPADGLLDDLLWDCLAGAQPRAATGQPPAWLRWARSELDRCDRSLDIGGLAADAGVHRVHFTRQFLRHYGIAPAAYRQRQMAARALRALVADRLPPAAAAYDAGFADQSHMSRSIRATFGMTPRRIAALLAG